MKKISTLKSKLFIVNCVAAALAGSHSFAEGAAVDRADKSFLEDSFQDGLAEVKMGEMAQSKTANPDVKAFAAKMVTDHTKADSEMQTLADSKKVKLATEPTMVARGKAKLIDAKTGADFDKAYAEDMVTDHKKAVAAFQKAANESKDPDVKAFAEKTLPTLQNHLSMAEDLEKKVGK